LRVRPLLRFPALSLLPGQTPHHEHSAAALAKSSNEVPIKESIVASEYAKAAENNAQAERHKAVAYTQSAQAQLYLAQALKEKSETDLKDLEYVEQENGVHQERLLELERMKHSAHMESAQIGANTKDSEAIKGAETAFKYELSKQEQENKTALALEKLKKDIEIAQIKNTTKEKN